MKKLRQLHSSATNHLQGAMRIRRRVIPLLLLVLTGCGDIFGPKTDTWKSIQLDERVVHAYTEFGLNFFDRLVTEKPDSNVFASPTSAAFALAMAYNGAAGRTAEQMARALGIEGMTLEEVNRANQEWLNALANPGQKVELSLANSIWIRQGFPVEAGFIERNKTFYRAEVQQLNFNSPAAVKTINDWVSQNTRGKIPMIIERIGPLDMLFLINALYFKADWTHQFDKQQTRSEPFRLPDGTVKSVPMMRQRKEFPYFRGEGFSVTSLPYGNGRFSMVLALPDANSNLAALYGNLTPANLERWISELEGGIQVALPRFTIEWEKTLNDVLKGMGMQDAFDPERSDFAGINPQMQDLHISEVLQKTYLKVDEEGTTAAAVTSVRMGPTSAPAELTFNRPFFLAIRDNATGTLLFVGQVVDPS